MHREPLPGRVRTSQAKQESQKCPWSLEAINWSLDPSTYAPALTVASPPHATKTCMVFSAGLMAAASKAARTNFSASLSFLSSWTCAQGSAGAHHTVPTAHRVRDPVPLCLTVPLKLLPIPSSSNPEKRGRRVYQQLVLALHAQPPDGLIQVTVTGLLVHQQHQTVRCMRQIGPG